MWGLPWPFKKIKSKLMIGIDVSHHNSAIRFDEVVKDKQNISFVFIKATEGTTYVDPQLRYNAIEAAKAGLHFSYYHFATLNTLNIISDAKAEAKWFVSQIAALPVPSLPLVLDIETNKASIPPDQVLLWIKTFFSELEGYGYNDNILYSYTPFLNANLPKDHGLGNVKLWIAAYTNLDSPRLPIGWSDYYIWQYSANGSVQGCKSKIDMNKTQINLF